MVEQAVDMIITSEVGDDRAGRRHEQDNSGMVAQEHTKCHDGHLEVDSLW